MPNYCHAPFLRERLDSILGQDYPNKEVILIDDASSDNSVEILQEYATRPEVKTLIINAVNSGNTFLQWQKGLQAAEGEYVWIAESDDVADVRLLSTLVAVLERPDAQGSRSVLAYARSVKIDREGQEIYRRPDRWERHDFAMDGRQFIKKHLLGYSRICNASAVVFRREAAMGVDMQRVAQYPASGDRLFWITLASMGAVSYVAAPLNRFRQHRQKVSGKAARNGENSVQDHAIYASVRAWLPLRLWDRVRVCGYHWQAIHQSDVTAEGRAGAERAWRQEKEYSRWAYIAYMLYRVVQKLYK